MCMYILYRHMHSFRWIVRDKPAMSLMTLYILLNKSSYLCIFSFKETVSKFYLFLCLTKTLELMRDYRSKILNFNNLVALSLTYSCT